MHFPWNHMPNHWSNKIEACRDSIDYCIESDRSTVDGHSTCAQATAICRNLVEGPYYEVSGRNPYDIRAQADAEIPPGYWADFVNLASTQEALGVNINYTSTSSQAIWIGFSSTGDFVYPDILSDLEAILDDGVSIHLIYGDAVSFLALPLPCPALLVQLIGLLRAC